ncbi:MAG: hypothetical protein J4F42_04150 [Desulfurellaceae bacterium]|nr:hypothetical protein [Desulfurellaceae bacterium]
MSAAPPGPSPDIRYEPDERPPHLLSFGLGFQYALLVLAGIVLTPAIVIRAASQSEAYLSWAIFAALVICGLTTTLQAARLWRIGSGHVLIMGTSGTFIAVCIAALVEGGPGLLATLIVVSSLFQFALSARLALLRRIITPVVSGTVIALIAVTIMPIMFQLLTEVPEGTPLAAAPVSAAVTLVTSVAFVLRASGIWRLWAPVIGIGVGCVAASLFGLYDTEQVGAAAWVGFPTGGWAGFDLSFGPAFWALLPAFVFVTLVGAIETVGDTVAVQRVSWRTPRAVDFRTVQGSLAADGLGNLLSGFAATVPNTTYSSSVPLAELTGVAARSVGVCMGIIFVVLAFFPKVTALLLAIPNPVVGAYAIILFGLLFMQGMKIVVQDGIDYRKAVVAGLSFWIGVGFQNGVIFADYFNETWGALLGNGMTMGGLAAVVLSLFMEVTGPRRRLEMGLNIEAVPNIERFLRGFASRLGWNTESTERLCSAGEETLLTLLRPEQGEQADEGRRLLVVARSDANAAELEFVSATGEQNLEDQLALLEEGAAGTPAEDELSLRLLRHFASSVRHQQYHDTAVVTVRVEASGVG